MSDAGAALGRLRGLRAAGASVADEPAGKALLRAIGVETPEGRVVEGPDAAAAAAAAVGMPVAVKLVARDLSHKSDVGAVAGPLGSAEEVRDAAARIARAGGEGLLVERWVQSGVACFAGLAMHTTFGPVVSFGLGGVWVEILRDVAYRLAPVSEREVLEMARSLRGTPLLEGARGRPAVDLAAVAASVARLSRLAHDPEALDLVAELDVNPLLARVDGPPLALDATVVLRGAGPPLEAPARPALAH